MSSNIYVTLLRGINVSGQKPIKMVDLCKLYQSLGFDNVTSYIQSGNVIFSSKKNGPVRIKESIEKLINKQFDFDVPVEIRTNFELKNVIENFPYNRLDADEDGTKYLVAFLSKDPGKVSANDIKKHVFLPERLTVIGREVYLHCPMGSGKSKLSNSFIEKKLGVDATTRNWKTVKKLYELSMH